jgi:hypothetical protein
MIARQSIRKYRNSNYYGQGKRNLSRIFPVELRTRRAMRFGKGAPMAVNSAAAPDSPE